MMVQSHGWSKTHRWTVAPGWERSPGKVRTRTRTVRGPPTPATLPLPLPFSAPEESVEAPGPGGSAPSREAPGGRGDFPGAGLSSRWNFWKFHESPDDDVTRFHFRLAGFIGALFPRRPQQPSMSPRLLTLLLVHSKCSGSGPAHLGRLTWAPHVGGSPALFLTRPGGRALGRPGGELHAWTGRCSSLRR